MQLQRLPIFLVATVLCLQMPWLVEKAQTADSPSSFCSEEAVKNYLKPIEGLPRVRTVPSSGRLGVGPASLRIFPPNESLVVAGKARFEAQGSLEGSPSSGPLHWRVRSSLFRINSASLGAVVVARKQTSIRSIQAFSRTSFGFSKQVRTGIYRLDIEIENARGKKLKRYQRYFRALKAQSDLRLGVSDDSFRPGDTGFLRIENYGTVSASYGFGYHLLNEKGEEVPTTDVFSALRLNLLPGTAGRCFSFELPKGLSPGKYEIYSYAGDRLRSGVRLPAQISVSP